MIISYIYILYCFIVYSKRFFASKYVDRFFQLQTVFSSAAGPAAGQAQQPSSVQVVIHKCQLLQ